MSSGAAASAASSLARSGAEPAERHAESPATIMKVRRRGVGQALACGGSSARLPQVTSLSSGTEVPRRLKPAPHCVLSRILFIVSLPASQPSLFLPEFYKCDRRSVFPLL